MKSNFWRRRRAECSLIGSLVILAICVQCCHGAATTTAVSERLKLLDSIVPSSCGGGLREYLGGVLEESSNSNNNDHASHFEEGVSGSARELVSNTTLCKSSKNACCTSSLIPKLFPTLVPRTFNNSLKYNAFKTQINTHLNTMNSYNGSANPALWNATLDGMNVLRNWGLKYWDPVYLQRHNVFSSDCMRILVQNWACPGCGEVVPEGVKPCKALCHNTVMGCLKSPLAEFIEQNWKQAVNSVRTAVRLVMTTSDESASGVFRQDNPTTHPLSSLVTDLNDWREPITWWLPEYKRSTSCESLPNTACWNGETVGQYEFASAQWKSNYNPEFSSTSHQGVLNPSVILELDRFRTDLVNLRKTLEKYWPTTSHPVASLKSSSALPLTSLEDMHLEGSGDGFDSDDEDLEYINSGYGPHIDSDDEDLGGWGSGDHGSGGSDIPLGGGSSTSGGIGGRGDAPPATTYDGPTNIINAASGRVELSFFSWTTLSLLFLVYLF